MNWGVLLILVGQGMVAAARAETYNFYFNNTEQEKNAKAEPKVGVQAPSEVVIQPAGESPQESTGPVVVMQRRGSGSALVLFGARLGDPEEYGSRRFRFDVGGFVSAHPLTLDGGGGAIFGAAYFPANWIGFRGFFGVENLTSERAAAFLGGGEVVFAPVRLDAFRVTDFITAALTVGLSNSFGYGPADVFPHVGLRTEIGIASWIHLQGYLMGSAGFVLVGAGAAVSL